MTQVKPDPFGGALFLAAGISFGVAAVLFFFADVLDVRNVVRAAYGLLGIFFLTGLGCPSALSSQTGSRGSFDKWTATLATVGLAVGIIDSARAVYLGTLLLPWPEGFPAMLKRADPLGIIIFPSIGLWVLASSFTLRGLGPSWRKLGNGGMVCGALLFTPPVTEALAVYNWRYSVPLFGVVVLAMSAMVLLWFGGVGLRLLRAV